MSRRETQYVTYVVVVHGIGEQRKNECVINVVNRFAEARRGAQADDNRDVLTLGKASSQTGFSKVPVTAPPWMEFEGIPASPYGSTTLAPFLGESPTRRGDNLRFVDLCWSDVMQDSVEHVGQDVNVWTKGLVGRLLRKHEAAKAAAEEAKSQQQIRAAEAAKVPFWIRRILYVLADTLLVVRFAMNFRFKEMKELVFVKFLGDVQLYGEYDRCRGRAVRRFHELLSKVEAAHYSREPDRGNPRTPRYVILAHSLGSIMSLDALLYARATSAVRLGRERQWEFPGYVRDSARLAPPDAGWAQRVRSFVTLGSPIDKYLTIWWSNYRYLLNSTGLVREAPKIAHFNYCDELDPVGHSLDVVRATPVYKAVFEGREDVVFNRYSVPGVAHNEYWTDQRLFRWILHRAVDADSGKAGRPPKRPGPFVRWAYLKLLSFFRWIRGSTVAEKQPRWFRRRSYWMLLFWLYVLVPVLVLLGTYATLTLALQADGWRTAAVAAVAFSFLVYFGRRLVDLSMWWRQIQREKSRTFWADRSLRNSYRNARRRAGTAFRVLVVSFPFILAAQTTSVLQAAARSQQSLGTRISEDSLTRLLLVGVLVAVTILAWRLKLGLPKAYRTPIKIRREAEALLVVAGWTMVGIGVALHPTPFPFPVASMPDTWMGTVASLSVVATVVSAYCLHRFLVVKSLLRLGQPRTIRFEDYARRK